MTDLTYTVAAFAGALYLLKRSKKPDPPEPDPALEEFRAECMADGQVACEWTTLETRLVDQTVSGLWWQLTRDERYSIAEMAIKNTLFYNIGYRRTGKPNCEGGEGVWSSCQCVPESIIRRLKFAKFPIDVDPYWSPNADECYYKRYEDSEEHCFVSDTPYGLPCHGASRVTEGATNHAMAAIQIVDAVDSIDNWIIFQYSDFDIKPGDRQMPLNSRVRFYHKPIGFQCGASYGTLLATFYI